MQENKSSMLANANTAWQRIQVISSARTLITIAKALQENPLMLNAGEQGLHACKS
jgi:hypothetical protein